MRHQTKRKYADRKNLNRKYHPQKAYRKQQKRKTGWRARWDKFTDRLANIFGIDFLILLPVVIIYGMVFSLVMTFIKTISTVFGNLKAISLPYPTKEVAREVRLIGRLFKMEMSSSKMHALMRLNALMDGNLIEVYAKEHLLSDLPTKNGYNYLKMYVRKDNYLTYNG